MNTDENSFSELCDVSNSVVITQYDNKAFSQGADGDGNTVGRGNEAVSINDVCVSGREDDSIDRTPHQLFVELDELVTHTDADAVELMEWKEKARWIKFEEDVLGDADRWGLPHVASLSFQSLIDLHKALENGLISLDLEVTSSANLMQLIVNQLVEVGQLSPANQHHMMDALMIRHSHQNERNILNKVRSQYTEPNFKNMLHHHHKATHLFSANSPTINDNDNTGEIIPKDTKDVEAGDHEHLHDGQPSIMRRIKSFNNSEQSDKHYNRELLKKIPTGAEVTSVLVGTMTELEKPCIAFIRLSKGKMLDNIAEVPLPVRFLFICLGPELSNMDYIEIGRSLSTLMANEQFHTAVYQAMNRQHILTAMNSFLDSSLVLPPGDFDRKTLLPIMHMAKQMKQKGSQKKQKPSSNLKALGNEDIESSTSGTDVSFEKSGDDSDDPLRRTGRPFGGLVKDIRRRYPKYWNDIKDGFNLQVVAAMIFIYFAAISPAITFGGLLDEKTDGYIGASEMLLSTTISGIVFSLFSGQPLLIVGATGPLLVFEEGVYKFAKDNDIDYLSWRLWVGVWIFIIALIHLATEATFLIRYVTRFTQEVFAFLIALIFIYETFAKLVKIFQQHPLCWNYEDCLEKTGRHFSYLPKINPDIYNTTSSNASTQNSNITTSDMTTLSLDLLVHPNTALLSMSLTLFTFSLAYFLKQLRNKKVLGRTIRRALGDFGVPIAIFLLCLADFLIGDDVYTQKLSVPETISVTSPEKRGWLINPKGVEGPLPVGHIFSAAIPALLGSILIFMETLLIGMIVNKKEHQLTKGTGFHLDILLMGLLGVVSGFLGLPFMTCATVRSVAHTSALTVISKNHAPGEQPKLERIIEQRLSNFVVHILVGASMFLGMILSYIPIAVLFGVFLYMGVASLGGIQLYNRLVLMITPTKHHPVDVGYVRYVRVSKMHIFTLMQLLCVGALWAVKSSPGALAFPFVLLLLVPFRFFILKRVFTQQELNELDNTGSAATTALDQAGQEDEPDFYEQAHMPI